MHFCAQFNFGANKTELIMSKNKVLNPARCHIIYLLFKSYRISVFTVQDTLTITASGADSSALVQTYIKALQYQACLQTCFVFNHLCVGKSHSPQGQSELPPALQKAIHLN